jgi:hypothetical protein
MINKEKYKSVDVKKSVFWFFCPCYKITMDPWSIDDTRAFVFVFVMINVAS